MSEYCIKPGFAVKNAAIKSLDSVDTDFSVIPTHVKKLIDNEVNQTINKLNHDFSVRLKEAEKESYNSGYKEGKLELEKFYKDRIEKILTIFTTIIDETKTNLNSIYKKEEQNLLELSIAIAHKVVQTQIELDNSVVLRIISRALALINEKRKLVIKVNQAEWSFVKENFSTLNISTQIPEDIEIEGSDSITPGSCKIEYLTGSVDADINTQFAELKRKLLTKDEPD